MRGRQHYLVLGIRAAILAGALGGAASAQNTAVENVPGAPRAAASDAQRSLERAIAAVDEARERIQSAVEAQLGQFTNEARTALDELETALHEQFARGIPVAQSLGKAQTVVEREHPNQQEIVQALTRVVADVRQMQQVVEAAQRGAAGTATTAASEGAMSERTPLPASGHIAAMGTSLVGRQIIGPDTTSIGTVVDVVRDGAGQVQSVLVDSGGFLGIGARRVAVPVSELTVQNNQLVSSLTRQQIEQLPEHRATGQ